MLILARCCAVYIWWSNTKTSEETDGALNIDHDQVKVSYFQNEFIKSLFLPKYERKIVRISALCSEGRNLVHILGETMTS